MLAANSYEINTALSTYSYSYNSVCLKKDAAHMISSNLLFCSECGAANESDAPLCFACKQPLCSSSPSPPVQPVIQYAALAAPAPVDCLSSASLLAQRYRIISQVGQRAFAVVYKAKDRKNKHRLSAIKQINRSRLSPPETTDATPTYNPDD